MRTTRFYTTPDEAEANIESYLRVPPQVTSVTALVHQAVRPLFTMPDRIVVSTVTHQVEWQPTASRQGQSAIDSAESAALPPDENNDV
jgi:hypothetical protein